MGLRCALGMAVLLSVSADICAAAAWVVRARDGAVHRGDVRFCADGRVAVVAGASMVRLALDEMDSLELSAPATQPATRPAAPAVAWTGQDIGEVFQAGRFTVSGDQMEIFDGARRLVGDGKKRESTYFVHKPLPGDGSIVARFRTLDDSRYAKAGLMLRESLQADCPFVMLGRTNERETTFLLTRPEPSAAPAVAAQSDRSIVGAVWLKLERCGDRVDGYESLDGSRWVKIGSGVLSCAPDRPALIGIAAASSAPGGGRTLVDRLAVTTHAAAPMRVACARGIVTRSGSVLPGEVPFADQTKVVLRGADATERTFAPADVARLVFRDLDEATVAKLDGAAPGALLAGGDFVEGTVQEVNEGRLKLSSVLFGLRTWDVARQVVAAVFRQTAAGDVRFEVRTADGTTLLATGLTIAEGVAVAEDPVIGTVTVPAGKMLAIRRLQSRQQRP